MAKVLDKTQAGTDALLARIREEDPLFDQIAKTVMPRSDVRIRDIINFPRERCPLGRGSLCGPWCHFVKGHNHG